MNAASPTLSVTWRRMVGRALAGLTDPTGDSSRDRRTNVHGDSAISSEEEMDKTRNKVYSVMDHLLFLGALMDGDRTRVMQLVEEGKVNINDMNRGSVLLIACQRGSVDFSTLRSRLRGARLRSSLPKRLPTFGRTASQESKYVMSTIEGVRLLVELGLDVKQSSKVVDEITGMGPLHFLAQAGDSECCRYLLSLGADAKETDYFGLTPLHFCCWKASSATVSVLLEYGASATKKSINNRLTPGLRGVTPFHMIFSQGNNRILEGISPLYLEGLGIEIEEEEEEEAHEFPKDECETSHFLNEQIDCVELLLSNDANPIVTDCRLYNSLHYAVIFNASPVLIEKIFKLLSELTIVNSEEIMNTEQIIEQLLYTPDLFGNSAFELSQEESSYAIGKILKNVADKIPHKIKHDIEEIEKVEEYLETEEEGVCTVCNQLVPLWSLTSGDHQVVCLLREVVCPNKSEGCTQLVKQSELSSHFMICPQYTVVCLVCHCEISRMAMDDHINNHIKEEMIRVTTQQCVLGCSNTHCCDNCDVNIITCPSCEQEMPYNQRVNHICFRRTMSLLT